MVERDVDGLEPALCSHGEPLVCYQQLQQDQGQGGGPTSAPRLTQLSLIEEITWL